MIRFGLCCLFKKAPIKFRTARANYVLKLEKPSDHLHDIIYDNIKSLKDAILYCKDHNIGCFRVTSKFLPLFTHPEINYVLNDEELKALKEFKEYNIRLTLHPDQFVVLNSQDPDVVERSIKELEYHSYLAELIGADVINIHAGGVYKDKKLALESFKRNFERLSLRTKERLTLENDDRSYTPKDLLSMCRELKIPFVYDIHHHRCLPDDLSVEEVTKVALETWNREPLFHISSSKGGSRAHSDYIRIEDFPEYWKEIKVNITVEVEAKAKELAIEKLCWNYQK